MITTTNTNIAQWANHTSSSCVAQEAVGKDPTRYTAWVRITVVAFFGHIFIELYICFTLKTKTTNVMYVNTNSISQHTHTHTHEVGVYSINKLKFCARDKKCVVKKVCARRNFFSHRSCGPPVRTHLHTANQSYMI